MTRYFLPYITLQLCLLLSALAPTNVLAASQSELEQCLELSNVDDELHNCMDNFLDAVDAEMALNETVIIEQLGGSDSESAQAFTLSQQAFFVFRRDNCLWYQAFSEPHVNAALIAKSCLLNMSHARLAEFRQLLDQKPAGQEFRGYYQYGMGKNTLTLCGSSDRYWVAGDANEVSRLRQLYRKISDTDNALLYVMVTGEIDNTSAGSAAEYKARFLLTGVSVARTPLPEDCLTAAAHEPVQEVAGKQADTTANINEEALGESSVVEAGSKPQELEHLRAYFGAWVADCGEKLPELHCVLSTPLQGEGLAEVLQPVVKIFRHVDQYTALDIEYPGQEISSAQNISWRVDTYEFGFLQPSKMRVDDTAVVHEIRHNALIERDLLPQMIAGSELRMMVRDDSGKRSEYRATLIGLTRALQFADEFLLSSF